MNGASASHYACALADAVLSPDSDLEPQQAVDQLRSAESLLAASRQLQLVLLSPAVSRDQKIALIRQLANQCGFHKTICNFLLIITLHRRTSELKQMCSNFGSILDTRLGRISAEISSARELTAEQRGEIERVLRSSLGKEIRARYKIDPFLLGGIKASVDSKEYDATIRGRLERLRAYLDSNTTEEMN